MSKKSQAPPKPLGERILRARQEKRTQQALELARTLYKDAPSDSHREILRQVTLERALALKAAGYLKDATTLYSNALQLGGATEDIARAVRGLAECGAVTAAMAALDKIPDPAARQSILNHIVDGAIAQGADGKAALPESLHAHFDLLLQAFRDHEQGNDEAARNALQSIGLQSPFLEWKVLLRGLIAYHANDDARAVENWQRLDPVRLPARACMALRAGIDPQLMKAQSPAGQQLLQARLLELHGASVAPALRELRPLLVVENLAPAFRKVEAIVPILRRDYPDLAKRLTYVFFWSIINHGRPEDVDRLLRVFGSLPDDPHATRLQALALESHGVWESAHEAWQAYLKDIAAAPATWPGAMGTRAQALIWSRMAENAGGKPSRGGGSGNPFLDLLEPRAAPLNPGAEQCLENAIKLAPDNIENYRALFYTYRDHDKDGKAKKIAQEALKRFPNDFQMLDALAGLFVDNQEYKQALSYLEQAVQANPLDRELQGILAIIRQRWGLQLTIEGKFDAARAQYELALKAWTGPKTAPLCQWAACELKAKNAARAEELITEAMTAPNQRLACKYALVGESIRAKLPPKEKKRIAAELEAALAQTPMPGEIVTLIYNASQQHIVHDKTFVGQKKQERTILKFLEQMKFDTFNEGETLNLLHDLEVLEARKPWLNCLNNARRRFLKNPQVRLSFVSYYVSEKSSNPKTHLAREHLDAARRLVGDMPRGEAQQRLLDAIQAKEELIAAMESHHRGMMDVFDRIFSNFDPDFDDDDDDYDE